MARGRRPERCVAFFVEHDLIDETRERGMGRRHPRCPDTGQALLEGLQQRHEVEHTDAVVLHEDPQPFEAAH